MKSVTSILLLNLFFFFSGEIRAQVITSNEDSTEAAELYSRAVWLFGEKKIAEAKELVLESLDLSAGSSDVRSQLPALSLLARITDDSGNPSEAIPYYLRILSIYEDVQDTSGLISTSSTIAGNYYKLEAFEKAGAYYLKAYNLLPGYYNYFRASYLEDLGFCSLNSGNPDSAIVCFSLMKQNLIAAKLDDTKALYFLVKAFNAAGRYEESMLYNQALFDRFEKTSDYQKMSGLKNNIAYNLTLLKRYTEAANTYKEAIDFSEKAGNPPGDQALLMMNRSICLQNNGQWRPAVNYFQDAIRIFNETKDFSKKSIVEDMVAKVYFSRGDLYNAGLFSMQSIESAKLAKDANQLAESCLTYSKVLREGNDPIQALEFYEQYLQLRDSIQFEKRIKEEKLSGLKFDLEKSEKELNLKVREEQVKKLSIRQLTLQLEKEERERDLMLREKEVDKLEKEGLRQSIELGNQRHAAEQNAREKQILEQENNIKDLRLEHESRKQKEQAQEITLLETQKERDNLMIQKQKDTKKAMIWIIVLTVLAALSILANLITTHRKNALLAAQKKEIQEQNTDLEQKNDEISAQRDEIESQRDLVFEQKEQIEEIHSEMTKSIEYAKKIQTSIIPKPEELTAVASESFVFFRPRDIVSGDFYWFGKIENATVLTVADCTGHGVPGAIMSMLGMSLLKEIVTKEYITQPAVILRKLRKEIIAALGQKGISGEQRDGMDMSLICIHHDTRQLEYAGAFNPMYLVRRKSKPSLPAEFEVAMEDETHKLHIFQADKMPVAHYDRMDKYANQEFQYEEGDQIYLFTDGYADQFGGPNEKKFMYKPFMTQLLQNASQTMERQGEILSHTFNEWKGDHEQIDDVCVLGIRL
jgi:serine phosphatase RsbU (regulator of sigma subunit)